MTVTMARGACSVESRYCSATSNLASRSRATLRDTLLPKFISGELRVKGAEWFVGWAA
jgi:hypothetical protein